MFYALEISGMISLYFTECQNVGIAHEVVEYKEGVQIRKRPGKRYAKGITLTRPVDNNMTIWDWYRTNLNTPSYYNASLVAYNQESQEVARWNLTKVWPNRLVTKTGENNVVLDILSIMYEDIDRVK